MSLRAVTRWVAVILVLIGTALIALRRQARNEAQAVPGDTLWRVTYKAAFQATHPGARLRVALPSDTNFAKVFHEDILYSGLSAGRMRSSRGLAREFSLVAGRVGEHTLTARFDVHVSPTPQWSPREPDVPKTQADRDLYLKPGGMFPTTDPSVRDAIARMPTRPGLSIARSVFDFCSQSIEDETEGASDVVTVLRTGTGSDVGCARLMVTLCRALNIPARIVTGFKIEAADHFAVHTWAEALEGDKWVPYDPAGGFAAKLPPNIVPVRRDGIDVVSGTEISSLDVRFEVKRLPPGPGAMRYGHGKPSAILDLARLPLEMHEPLQIILLMPLGALVTGIFRTIVGIRTFGTFTPTLLALSFVYAEWSTGLLTFVIVLTLGLTSRTLLDRLKLLLVPRLGAMLTLVVLMIVFTVSVLDYFNLTPSAQAVILPMVILTMTVERFYLTSEEDSMIFAFRLLGGTVVVGVCCYLVLRWERMGQFVLSYPEVHLYTIAAMVLLGRFSGYRLTELWRFRDLVESKKGEA
ncbi:7TM domain-containing protein [Humisphaera borealis]|uniref:Transglutaminase-like domain-containing protein n=1 Tax=Humisphaera borealis TaxID=2807512 RepID=A0A7M2WUL0_9BACT|nr:7TM domain-containing protein [Humisphaera borealis]QOV89186.1 hypothetical protein IPV69_23715 [Humisphaera borealis]